MSEEMSWPKVAVIGAGAVVDGTGHGAGKAHRN